MGPAFVFFGKKHPIENVAGLLTGIRYVRGNSLIMFFYYTFLLALVLVYLYIDEPHPSTFIIYYMSQGFSGIMPCILCVLLLFHFTLTAQTSIGIKAGASAMYLNFTPPLVGKSELVPGYEGGFVLQHVSEPHLGIQMGVTLARVGWQQTYDSVNYLRQTFYNINVPFTTYLYFGKPQSQLFFNVGPVLSYTVSIQSRGRASVEAGPSPLEGVSYNRLAYGLTGGIGAARKTGAGVLQLEARLVYRLSSLLSASPAGFPEAGKPLFLNGSVAYLLDWNYFLGKRNNH